jgi:HTH-type transcriptional regulator/antitoxin HigA
MSVILADPVEMIRLGAPRVIRCDEGLEAYTEVLFCLTARAERTEDDADAIELLSLLIDRYEKERYPVPDAGAAEVLRFLIERHGLAKRDLVPELGSESTVSLVLSGGRQLTRGMIERLSKRFGVGAGVSFAPV